MTITRLAFFKLMAAVGIGQATTRTLPTQSSGEQCLGSDRSGPLKWVPCHDECADGEEKCPLGHCQKPQKINGTTSSLTLYAAGHGNAIEQIEISVCSVCGVVYVQPATAAREVTRP